MIDFFRGRPRATKGSAGLARGDAAGDRQVERSDEVLTGPVVVDPVGEGGLLRALRDQGQHWPHKLSEPTLNFPASANQHSMMIQFGGTTVDGVSYPAHPALSAAAYRR